MFVSVITVRGILEQVERHGVAREDILRGTELTEEKLADMRTMVGTQLLDTIVERAITLTKNPALGLSIGERAPESLGQLLAALAMSVPTLEEAYHLFERFSPIMVDDLHLSLSKGEEYSQFRYDFHAGMKLATARYCAEVLTAIVVRLTTQRFGRGEHVTEVRFRYPAPLYHERYEAVFGCPVRFDAPSYVIVFPTSLFENKQAHADTAMADMLRTAAEHMLTQVGTTLSLTERVRTLLHQKTDLCNLDTERLARELGMSHRVLRRRLSGEGSSMSALIEQARIDRARVELLRPGATIKQTAENLGYSEPSAFHRAFKRWTGLTPVLFVREQFQARSDSQAPRESEG